MPTDCLARTSIPEGASTSASASAYTLSRLATKQGLFFAAESTAALPREGLPDPWAAAGWTSELHAELRASVRTHRTQTLVARAIAAAAAGDCGSIGIDGTASSEVAARRFWAADEAGGESTTAASRTLYIGGGGLPVTEGDVLGIVEAAAARRGAARALLRSVSVSRGWAFAEMVSEVEVSRYSMWSGTVFPLLPSPVLSFLCSNLFFLSFQPHHWESIMEEMLGFGKNMGRERLHLQYMKRDTVGAESCGN